MLIIKKLYSSFPVYAVFASVLFFACSEKKNSKKPDDSAVELDSAEDFYEQADDNTVYDYHRFAGIYDHESTTKGFSAILVITENGNDLAFTLSVAQAGCKGEAKGNILMISHEPTYYVGFYEADECPLQFTLMLSENKIDVKEVNLCRLHESNCAFEGGYVKRKQ